MNFSKEEKNTIKKYLPMIEQEVKDSAISNITFDFRKEITDIAVNHKLISCIKCNSALYMAIQRVYSKYVAELREISNKKTNKTNVKN